MAAVIDLRTGTAVSHPQRSGGSVPHRRPALTVIQGGRSTQAQQLRRTYLRRRLAVAVGAVLVVAVVVAGASSFLSGLSAGPSQVVVAHRVERGDTLWSVAVAADPTGDPRRLIEQIVELNSTDQKPFSAESPLRVGQELRVPTSRG